MKKLVFFWVILTGVFILNAADTGVVCTPDGVCYLPGTAPAAAVHHADVPSQFTVMKRGIGMMDTRGFLDFLQGTDPAAVPGEFWGMLLLALAGGFLLNLTPCVLPMIPVNLAIIGANGGASGCKRGFLYGTGMCIAYGILGVLAAFAGIGFGGLNSSPVFNLAVGVLFLIMALAMSGAVQLDFQKFRPQLTGKFNRGGILAPVLMGALAALLAGACVAPAVASVLVYTAGAVTAGKYYAVLIPFVMGAGMALPWPIAGAGIAILPKPGKFMNLIKYLLAAVIFFAAVFYLLTGIKLAAGKPEAAGDGFSALEAARQQSNRNGRPILVKFTASWCKNCAAMERGALADARVQEVINEKFIPVTFPAEDPTEPQIATLLKAWQIPGFPAFVILKAHPENKK